MKVKLFFILLIIIFRTSICIPQSDLVEDIDYKDNNSISSDTAFNSELIYLQTNKGIYETSEDLWFKAYILDAKYFIPSGLSKTLYVQLMNEENGKIVWQEKYPIQRRFADGHVFINDTLPEGNYLLMAFTQYSFFDDENEFESSRRIVVKKNMEPPVLIKAEFKQPSFTIGDTIGLQIIALSELSKPLYTEITAVLFKGVQILETLQANTNKQGRATLSFSMGNATAGLTIDIKAKHTNTIKNIKLKVPFHQGSSIQFNLFPEGGYLVSGLKNKLAFKAVNTNGDPIEVAGTLFENSDSLISFKSFHAGMGSFEFTPQKKYNYHIRLSQPPMDSIWQLPDIQNSGVVFHLDKMENDSLKFKVQQNPNEEEKVIYFKGSLRGNTYCLLEGKLKENLEINISQREFPQQGIVEFTLLDSNFQPFAERLVYINPDDKLNIKTKLSKEKYSTREKIILNIKVTDKFNRPVVAHLGVSVFEKIYLNNLDEKNILTHFYLSTQLKGKIYNPRYYFDPKNEDGKEALDLLLQTQGWREYVRSKKNVTEEKDNFLLAIYDEVYGKVEATKAVKRALKGYQLIEAYNPAVNNNKYRMIADSNGTIKINPKYLALGQGGYIFLTPQKNEFKNRITIFPPFDIIKSVLLKKDVIYPKPGQNLMQKKIKINPYVNSGNNIVLDEVTIQGKKKIQFRDKYLGYLDSLTKINLGSGTDYVDFHGALNCPFHTDPALHKHRKPVEGETVFEYIDYDLSKGRVIKASRPFVYHYPKYTLEELLELNNLTRIKGYYVERKFYQPNYDDITDSLEFIPDFRNTLFWAPSVLTNKNGEAELKFFSSDIYHDFVGLIEGVSGDGKLGSEKFEVEVLKLEKIGREKSSLNIK